MRVLLGTSEASFAGAARAGNKKLRPSVTYTVQPLADGSINLRNPKGRKVGHFTAPLTATGPGPLAPANDASLIPSNTRTRRLESTVPSLVAW